VKHLEAYQKDGLVSSLSNTFSFDGYDPQLREHLIEVFHKHGVPIDSNFFQFRVEMAKQLPLPQFVLTEQWRRSSQISPGGLLFSFLSTLILTTPLEISELLSRNVSND